MKEQDKPGPGLGNSESLADPLTGCPPRTDAQAPAAAGPGQGAPPSNTAPGTYKDGETWAKVLRYGVDSLYLSYEGELYGDVEGQLSLLKLQAQGRDIKDRAKAQFEVLGHCFEVWDRGQRGYPYILQDNAFRLCIASSMSRRLPMVYAAISSEFLAHKGPEAAQDELRGVVRYLGDGYDFPNTSRVDLFADFQTNADLELPGRRAWVGRSRSVNGYSQDDEFTGWTIGQGAVMSARLYNKTIEAAKSNKPWLFPLWSRGGLIDGVPVWRVEFQVMGAVLKELGIRSFVSMLDNLGGIWQYATQDWLRFTLPQLGDSNRRRWPTHPVWDVLANLRWRLDDVPLTRTFSGSRVPSIERLQRMYMSLLTSFMAAKAITDYREGAKLFFSSAHQFHEIYAKQKYQIDIADWVEREVREKGRKFNTLSNTEEGEGSGDESEEPSGSE